MAEPEKKQKQNGYLVQKRIRCLIYYAINDDFLSLLSLLLSIWSMIVMLSDRRKREKMEREMDGMVDDGERRKREGHEKRGNRREKTTID